MSKNIKVKPGKDQSMTGFIVGLVFCAIGMFVVIPIFGLIGVLWTLIAVVITVMHAKNAFTEDGIATHEIVIEDSREYAEYGQNASQNVGKAEKGSVEERLQKVDDLYQKGLISSEEREQKRKDILGEI